MSRLTAKQPDGGYTADADTDALVARLGAFEDMRAFLETQAAAHMDTMERLKAEGKTKSVQYRELLGRKLMEEQTLQTIRLFVGE